MVIARDVDLVVVEENAIAVNGEYVAVALAPR